MKLFFIANKQKIPLIFKLGKIFENKIKYYYNFKRKFKLNYFLNYNKILLKLWYMRLFLKIKVELLGFYYYKLLNIIFLIKL